MPRFNSKCFNLTTAGISFSLSVESNFSKIGLQKDCNIDWGKLSVSGSIFNSLEINNLLKNSSKLDEYYLKKLQS